MKKLLAVLCAVCVLFLCAGACAESAAGVYTFHEQINPFLAIDWTITLNGDGTYAMSMTKPTGVACTYTGDWTQNPDGTVVTGTPRESTADIEAAFFQEDFSAVWRIDGSAMTPLGDSTGGALPEALPGEPQDRSVHPAGDVRPDALVGRTFAYDEVVEAFGFTVHWTLTIDDEDSATLIAPNDLMGDSVYACSWVWADGVLVTRITEIAQGQAPLAGFLDAQNGYEGRWLLTDADSSMTPLSQAEGIQGAGPVRDAASSDATFASVAYAAESAAQVCDIYLPEGEGPYPVIVLVHGGGFRFGDQGMAILQPVIRAGVANGYAVVSVDYRKSTEAIFPAALADVKAAVRFIRAQAETYGFDAAHVAVWGESAGAYLALMTALTPEASALNGDVPDHGTQPSSVTALVDFYGPVQFAAMPAEADALGFVFSGDFECQFAGVASLQDEGIAATSWTAYADQLPEGFALQAWIQAGNADTSVPYTQSVHLAEALSALIGEENVRLGILDGAAHEDAAFYTDENLAAVFAFLDACMK
ncbi:MAG: alpha/beta hydrolase fold domain-containing protein [Aristaeellaceae bacterium]